MAGTTKDVKIASNGLQLLGHTAITSFTEGTAGAEIASALYDITYEALLTDYRWRFATKSSVQLARLATPKNENFDFAFQLPADLLYLQRVTDRNLNYEIYEDTIQTNQTTVSIDYTFNIAADKLPPYYVFALQFLLASQFAVPVAGSESKAALYFKMAGTQLKKARFADATQRPAQSFVSNPYVDVRT